jgi:hypothetical protein
MKKILLSLSVTLMTLSLTMLTGCEKDDPNAISMDKVNKGIQTIPGNNGKEYEVVDLGLPSGNLWATCNMGATSPEQTGSLYAWGEVETKDLYSWTNYRWCNGTDLEITKYCQDRSLGTIDGKTKLDAEDEVTLTVMGQDWRIPTEDDFRELLTTRNCTAKWCKLNGVGGYLFTSVRKGYEDNSLFIPLAGMQDNSSTRFKGQYGWYWCNALYYDTMEREYNTKEANALLLQHTDIDNHYMQSRPRCVGLPIRAIYIGQ